MAHPLLSGLFTYILFGGLSVMFNVFDGLLKVTLKPDTEDVQSRNSNLSFLARADILHSLSDDKI